MSAVTADRPPGYASLRLRGQDGALVDSCGVPFCTLMEWLRAKDKWKGLPPVVIGTWTADDGWTLLLFVDDADIHTPQAFRAALGLT